MGSNLIKLANDFYKLCLAGPYRIAPSREHYELLLKIDTQPYHYLATAAMNPAELELAQQLEDKAWIALVPANTTVIQDAKYNWLDQVEYGARQHHPTKRALPERYVMRRGGNYALGHFDFDTLSDEMPELRHKHPKK